MGVFLMITFAHATTLAQRLAGRILLQVENHGEAWYVNPVDGNRYYMKDGATAYEMLRTFGLGISNKDFATLETGNASMTARLKGRILLKVENHGEAYYINPVDGKLSYLKDGAAAYQIMRSLSLGITNANLAMIPSGQLTFVGQPKVPTTPSIPTMAPLCGNGMVDASEECDGGDHCSATCTLVTKYQVTAFNFAGGFTDHAVHVGDKIAIGDGINIRIDAIQENELSPRGSTVRYSIWGNDSGNACKLVSASGAFATKDPELLYREFADSFLELVSINGTQASIRQYYGVAARERCDAIVSDFKKPLACALYPSSNHFFIDNGVFRTFFFGSENQLGAEYYSDDARNCYEAYIKKIPALAAIKPIGRNYRQLYSSVENVNAYSTDYERVFLPLDSVSASKQTFVQKFSQIKNGQCNAFESPIPHELAHMLFSRTFLQGTYDAGTKTEWTGSSVYGNPGSVTAEEGFAQYITTFISKGSTNSTEISNTKYWSSFCGSDRVLNAYPGTARDFSQATDTQMMYSNILKGNGYSSNSYQAGYCLYKRINDDCGDASMIDLLSKAIQYDGSMTSHPTMFKYLSDSCGESKVKSIMGTFGFDPGLLTMTQKWPNTDFPNSLNQPGCMQ